MFSSRIIELAVQWHYTYPALGDDHDLIAELAHRALVAYRRFAEALGEDAYPGVPEGTLIYWFARRFNEEARSPR